MHTWNYRDNRDNKQHYRDRRISIVAQPYYKCVKIVHGHGGFLSVVGVNRPYNVCTYVRTFYF